MASGANITVTGGTTMRQVVAGTDLIEDADFNNPRTNLDTLLTTAADVTLGTFTESSTFGWGQGGAGVSAASPGGLVYADNATGGFKRLQDDIQAACAFLGQTVRTGVGTDVTNSDTVSAATWNNLMLNVKDCWDNRFSPASVTTSNESGANFIGTWKNSLTSEITCTWSTEEECREFFNGGGKVGVNASRTGGSSTTQNTDWSNLLSAMGDVFLNYNTGSGSSGTNAGIGFYELTTSYQDIWTKFGSGAYASNFFKLEAKVNSTTNPTVITLKTTYSDPHAEGSGVGPDGIPGTGDDGYGNDYVDGTLLQNARVQTPDANGSGFSFTKPNCIHFAPLTGS